MQNNLTTLANVKSWAGDTSTSDDALLTRLIGNVSRAALSFIERPTLFQNSYADVYDGVAQRWQLLRYWPVLSVSTVMVGPCAITQSSGYGQPGWTLEPWSGFPPGQPQRLSLCGHGFHGGVGAVAIAYSAGFVTKGEAQTVPGSGYQVTPIAPNGPWAVDQGVTYANGTALTAVTSNPSTGQYVPPNPYASTPVMTYQFAVGDAGQAMLLSYSYIPADIEEVCCEWVVERYKYKDRVGTMSKSLGGQETVSFSQKDMPDFLRTVLQPYKRVALV